jgi:hypothetical protein
MFKNRYNVKYVFNIAHTAFPLDEIHYLFNFYARKLEYTPIKKRQNTRDVEFVNGYIDIF